MSKMSDFIGDSSKISPIIELDIDVHCHICFAYVETAKYHQLNRVLQFVCSNGHVSTVEDFKLHGR